MAACVRGCLLAPASVRLPADARGAAVSSRGVLAGAGRVRLRGAARGVGAPRASADGRGPPAPTASAREAATAPPASHDGSSSLPQPAAPIPGDHMANVKMGLPPGVKCEVFDELALESGVVLKQVPLAYSTYGSLNAAGDNAVIVGHSLTSNSNVHEWWAPMMGTTDEHALNPERDFIICCNYLGSPYGSASPVSVDPAKAARAAAATAASANGHHGGNGSSGSNHNHHPHAHTQNGHGPADVVYGGDFPCVSVRDNVRLQRRLLAKLGVTRLACAMGGSMGGMLALEWAASFPEFVDQLVVVAGCGRHPDWAIGTSEGQRQAIYADARWRGGHYPLADPPVAGLAAARMAAMLSYRAPASVDERFNRAVMGGGREDGEEISGASTSRGADAPGGAPLFAVASYLHHQGAKFVSRFDANCYVSLTRTLDSHDVASGPGRGGDYEATLASLSQRSLIVGIDSDVLYPLHLQEHLAAHLEDAELYVISSPHGHDSFLIEIERLNRAIARFRAGGTAAEPAADEAASGALATLEERAHEAESRLAEARTRVERESHENRRLRAKLAEMETRWAAARGSGSGNGAAARPPPAPLGTAAMVQGPTPAAAGIVDAALADAVAVDLRLRGEAGNAPAGGDDLPAGEGLLPVAPAPRPASLRWSADKAQIVYGRRDGQQGGMSSWGANPF